MGHKVLHLVILPFGLNVSPYFFSKIVRPIVSYLRSIGIRVVIYVDDLIVMAPEDVILQHRDTTLKLLSELGWFINYDKSSLTPSVEKP